MYDVYIIEWLGLRLGGVSRISVVASYSVLEV